MATKAIVVATRSTFDGITIRFWSDGAISDRNGAQVVNGRLPRARVFEFARDACLFTWNELPATIERFKCGKSIGVKWDIPEERRLYRTHLNSNGGEVFIRIR